MVSGSTIVIYINSIKLQASLSSGTGQTDYMNVTCLLASI